jgi:hypothetical protein
MKSTFTNSSRRHFIERLAIASTVLVASPTLLLANNSKTMLRFAVLGQDSVLTGIIDKSDKMTLVDEHTLADVIYVSESHQKSQKYIHKVLASGKHLIVESIGNDESLIEDCRKSGSLLTIVERSSDASKLFACTNFYQCEIAKLSDYQKVISVLTFLEQHTKPLKFKIKTEYHSVKIPVS